MQECFIETKKIINKFEDIEIDQEKIPKLSFDLEPIPIKSRQFQNLNFMIIKDNTIEIWRKIINYWESRKGEEDK